MRLILSHEVTYIVFIKGLSYQSDYISLLTLIQNFVSRYILKSERCKIDMDFYRPNKDSATAWLTVRGTPNPIINLHQPPPPFPWLRHYLHCSLKVQLQAIKKLCCFDLLTVKYKPITTIYKGTSQ